MELVIEGNIASYLHTRNIERGQFRLIGQPNQSKTLITGDGTLSFPDPLVFNEFSMHIKGGSPSSISLGLLEFHILHDLKEVTLFSRKTFTELNLFKSVFLIYNWVEGAYLDTYAIDLPSKIYNEFIIDFNSTPGPQEDIYFIRRELINQTTSQSLERLIDINLVVRATFSGGNLGTYQSYFIPLDKPGVGRSDFKHANDPTGDMTYNLWKDILRDRDTRISNWFKKKY